MKAAVFALLVLPLLCAAESKVGANASSAHLNFKIVIPPVFNVLQVRPMAGGQELRVWTNMKSVVIDGHEHRFARVGESVLRVEARPGGGSNFIVQGL